MFKSHIKPAFSILFVAVILIGCSAPGPYVWRPYTIDRGHEFFPDGPVLASGSGISICYSKRGTTPNLLKQMADEECGRFGMTSKFAQQDHRICPLATPIAAQFECVGASGQAVTQSSSPQPGTLFRGAGQNGVPGSVLPPSGSAFNAEDVSTTAKSAPYPTFLFNGQPTRP